MLLCCSASWDTARLQTKILQLKISGSFPISCLRKTQLITNALPVQPFSSFLPIHRIITSRIIANVCSAHAGKDQFSCCVVGNRKGGSNITAWDHLPSHSTPTPTISYPDLRLFFSLTQKTTVAIIFFEGAMIHKIREARKAFNCNLPPRAFCDFCNTVNIFMSPKEQKQVVVFANLSTRESFNCNLGGVLIATTSLF